MSRARQRASDLVKAIQRALIQYTYFGERQASAKGATRFPRGLSSRVLVHCLHPHVVNATATASYARQTSLPSYAQPNKPASSSCRTGSSGSRNLSSDERRRPDAQQRCVLVEKQNECTARKGKAQLATGSRGATNTRRRKGRNGMNWQETTSRAWAGRGPHGGHEGGWARDKTGKMQGKSRMQDARARAGEQEKDREQGQAAARPVVVGGRELGRSFECRPIQRHARQGRICE